MDLPEINPWLEDDAHLLIEMDSGNERRLDRYTSVLYTFVGRNALGEDISNRSHVYLWWENDEEKQGTYIFAVSPVFKKIASFMVANHFPSIVNMNQVPEGDEQAYQMMLDKELNQELADGGDLDFFPEDWTK